MKTKRKDLSRSVSLLFLVVLAFGFPLPAEADSIVVNTVDDNDDGQCDSTHCSLREAIIEANNTPGPDSIKFDIPGAPPHRILLCHALPALTDDATTLDGASEPDYAGTPVVMIEPVYVPDEPPVYTLHLPCYPPFVGLQIEADDVVVQGLGIGNFRYYNLTLYPPVAGGIVIQSGSHALIQHNYLGIDPSGQPFGNDVGVLINSSQHLIKENVISGNFAGVYDTRGHNRMIGNLIGTDPTGNFPVNNDTGIWLNFNATHDIIGGQAAGEGNLISGNNYAGIYIQTDNNTVLGNLVGTDITGNAAIPNGYGVEIYGGSYNIVGGTSPDQGNVISGSSYMGVSIHCSAHGNEIIGNLIGTDISGLQPLGNNTGIGLAGGWNVIGGEAPGAGNLIAFSLIEGIGLSDPTVHHRIIRNDIHSNTAGINIRTTWAGWPEQIAISRNQIHDNTNLGIDLFPQGVTLNDPGDADAGPNTLLNFPELTSASTSIVSGSVCPNCRVEIFLADGDPSGHGEGATYLGYGDADNVGNFTVPIQNVSVCDPITATTIDNMGNTSEFSANIYADCITVSPILSTILSLGLMLGGGIAAAFLGRRTDSAPVRRTILGALCGGVVACGGLFAVRLLPNLQFDPIVRPQAEIEKINSVPPCLVFFDDAAIMPQNGTVFDTDEEMIFSWPAVPDSAEGEFRWRVDLSRMNGTELTQFSTQNQIAFSAFGVEGSPTGVFHWSLSGEFLKPETGAWEPFCENGPYFIFEIKGPAPSSEEEESTEPTKTPTSTPTPTVTPEMCVYTALYNANCRASDYPGSALIGELLAGETAELVALNPALTHGKFELQNQQQCWIWLGVLDGPANPYGTCGVPVLEPPPEPTGTPTSPACRSDMDQATCEANGGTWSSSVSTAPRCICPD